MTTINLLKLFIDVYSKRHIKPINTLWGKTAELFIFMQVVRTVTTGM
jgi:hypothetical protein